MTKIFEINSCKECPNRTANDIYWYCKENDKGVINSYEIPLWCPLPNATQPVIEVGRAKACDECGSTEVATEEHCAKCWAVR